KPPPADFRAEAALLYGALETCLAFRLIKEKEDDHWQFVPVIGLKAKATRGALEIARHPRAFRWQRYVMAFATIGAADFLVQNGISFLRHVISAFRLAKLTRK